MAGRRAAALREPRRSADSYLDFVQGLDEVALTAVLRARQDVLEDPPRGVGELVRRFGDADSMLAAVNDLDRDGLLLCNAVMMLGPPVPLDRLVMLLGGSRDGIRAALRPVTRRALLWESDGVVHAFEPFRRLWDDEVAVWHPAAELIPAIAVTDLRRAARGLVPGARVTSSTTWERSARVVGELMADPDGVAAAVQRLPRPARDLLAELVRDPTGLVTGDEPDDPLDTGAFGTNGFGVGARGRLPAGSNREEAAGVLVESGLLLLVGGEIEVPREVVTVLWAADPEVRLTGPPSLGPAGADRADETFAAGIQAVHPAAKESLDYSVLAKRIVVETRGKNCASALASHVLDPPVQRPGEGVGDAADQQAERPGLLVGALEVTGVHVRSIAESLRGVHNSSDSRRSDVGFFVDDPRHGFHAHPRQRRDLAHGRTLLSGIVLFGDV